jgi:hypothetical protein
VIFPVPTGRPETPMNGHFSRIISEMPCCLDLRDTQQSYD